MDAQPTEIGYLKSMPDLPPEHEHGGEYRPDAFGALDSLDDMRSEGPALGCMAMYLLVVAVFLAELLRYLTGSGKYWLVLAAIPFLFPRVWAAFRMWQSPQVLDERGFKGMSLRDRRWWIVAAVVLMALELEFQLFWPSIRDFFNRAW